MLAKREENRREPRMATSHKATARVAISIALIDISLSGARARISIPLPVGTLIKLSLSADRMRHARVAWSDDGITGFEFLAPLTPADLAEFATAG
jgi:hypothetical protein